MKIALLTDGIHPYVIGGMQRHSYFVAKYLALKNIEVDLYHTSEQPGAGAGTLDIFDAEQKKFIRSFLIPFPAKGIIPGHYLRRSYSYSKELYKTFMENSRVDFIYTKGFTGWKLIEEKDKGKEFAPVGINLHGMNMFQVSSGIRDKISRYWFRPPARFLMKNSDYVFSYGGKITGFIQRAGITREKIIEIPTGIESEWVSSGISGTDTKKRFLFIGRYERLKGIEELSAAIKKFENRYDFEFNFIGPIPVHLRLKSRKVKYHGVITHPKEIQQVMDQCDILCCPSFSEGMPNSILEAMSRGLAILATDVGAIAEMVDGSNGWLLERCSVQTIEKAMEQAILCRPDELIARKRYSFDRVRQKFLWEEIINRLIGRLKEITGNS